MSIVELPHVALSRRLDKIVSFLVDKVQAVRYLYRSMGGFVLFVRENAFRTFRTTRGLRMDYCERTFLDILGEFDQMSRELLREVMYCGAVLSFVYRDPATWLFPAELGVLRAERLVRDIGNMLDHRVLPLQALVHDSIRVCTDSPKTDDPLSTFIFYSQKKHPQLNLHPPPLCCEHPICIPCINPDMSTPAVKTYDAVWSDPRMRLSIAIDGDITDEPTEANVNLEDSPPVCALVQRSRGIHNNPYFQFAGIAKKVHRPQLVVKSQDSGELVDVYLPMYTVDHLVDVADSHQYYINLRQIAAIMGKYHGAVDRYQVYHGVDSLGELSRMHTRMLNCNKHTAIIADDEANVRPGPARLDVEMKSDAYRAFMDQHERDNLAGFIELIDEFPIDDVPRGSRNHVRSNLDAIRSRCARSDTRFWDISGLFRM